MMAANQGDCRQQMRFVVRDGLDQGCRRVEVVEQAERALQRHQLAHRNRMPVSDQGADELQRVAQALDGEPQRVQIARIAVACVACTTRDAPAEPCDARRRELRELRLCCIRRRFSKGRDVGHQHQQRGAGRGATERGLQCGARSIAARADACGQGGDAGMGGRLRRGRLDDVVQQHVPLARCGGKLCQRMRSGAQAFDRWRWQQRAEQPQRGTQPPYADAQLMGELGVVSFARAAHVGRDLVEALPGDAAESVTRRSGGIERNGKGAARQRQRALFEQRIAALGLAAVVGQHGHCIGKPSRKGQQACRGTVTQFQFDLGDRLLAVTGDDFAAVDGDLDFAPGRGLRNPDLATEVRGEYRHEAVAAAFEQASDRRIADGGEVEIAAMRLLPFVAR